MKTGIELIKDVDNRVLETGQLAYWWIGQSGYIIKTGKTIIYIDAFLFPVPDRNIAPLLKPEEVVNADFILGTHEHGDHIDKGVWKQMSIASPNAKFVVPLLLLDKLAKTLDIPKERFIGLSDGLSTVVNGLKITGIAAAHEFLDRDPDTGLYPHLGYIIETEGRVIYHSGDCCIYEGLTSKLQAYKKIDVMFVPINGRSAKKYLSNIIGNMTYQEAADLAGVVKPGLVVPGHFEMASFNLEDPNLFTAYVDAKYPGQKYWVGEHGEAVII